MQPILSHHLKLGIRKLRWSHFLLLLVGFVAAALPATDLLAQKKGASAPAPAASNRFLFIVDTSDSMKRLVPDVLDVVDGIIQSSASGQLHRGDTVGVWTFNADVYTGNMPIQVWAQEDKEEIAMRTGEFLKQQHFEKKSRFEKALKGMYEVIQNSDIITIFIISNGEGKMQGSPFDDEINKIYKQDVKEMKKDRKPVVTVLQAKGGTIGKYTVNALPWPVVIPEVPIPLKIAKAAPATAPKAIEANHPPNVNRAATTPPQVAQTIPPQIPPPINPVPSPAPPAPAPAPVPNSHPVMPSATVAAPPTAPTTPLPTPHAQVEVAKNEVAVPPPVQPQSAPTEGTGTAQPLEPPMTPRGSARTVQVIPPPPEAAPAPAPAMSMAETATREHPEKAPVQMAEANASKLGHEGKATGSADAQLAMATPPASVGRPKILLIGGLASLVVAIGLIVVLALRSRSASGPSLITHSMGNPRK